jgi:phytoene dehydrogenase-like protein
VNRGTFDALVIGAGTNGLAAAVTLGRAGRQVLVVEQAYEVGGQARPWEFAPGFRAFPPAFDAGWMPPAVRRLCHPESRGGTDLIVPGIALSVAFESGGFLSLPVSPAEAAERIRPHSARDAAAWPVFVAQLRRMSGFLEALYQRPAPDIETTELRELVSLGRLGWRFRRLGREDMTAFLRTMPMAVAELAGDHFESEPLRAALASGGVQDIRQGPRSGGTGFVLLHHLVGAPSGSIRSRGWWRDGPDAPVRALVAAARCAGAEIRTGAAVERIMVEDDAVVGVALGTGEEIRAPLVLSTADPARTLLDLVDPVWLDPEFLHAVRQIRFRGVTAIVAYALDALPDFGGLEHPREALAVAVSLTPTVERLERAADAAKYGAMSERPHVEVMAPTLRWPALAPEGRHVLLARVQWAPYRLREGAWDRDTVARLERAVDAAIEAAAPGFTSRVLHRATLTPRDLAERYGLTEGAATHGELALDQILFMRPVAGWSRYAMPIRGLYLGGAGTHPGPGIVGGPGWLAARRAARS